MLNEDKMNVFNLRLHWSTRLHSVQSWTAASEQINEAAAQERFPPINKHETKISDFLSDSLACQVKHTYKKNPIMIKEPYHIFKDQSQGFLGVDDVMQQHDVGMLQALQKRRCRGTQGKSVNRGHGADGLQDPASFN